MSHPLPFFLVVQSRYHDVQVAVCEADQIRSFRSIDKKQASSQLIILIDAALREVGIPLSKLSALIAHIGPGPFTTLRVAIATVNGLGFAAQIPLIGIDGIGALCASQGRDCIALLDAFCNDVYFAAYQKSPVVTRVPSVRAPVIESGAAPIDLILTYLKGLWVWPSQVVMVGNAVPLYRQKIVEVFGDTVTIPDPLPLECSIEVIAQAGYQHWLAQTNITTTLIPLYLKSYSARMNG